MINLGAKNGHARWNGLIEIIVHVFNTENKTGNTGKSMFKYSWWTLKTNPYKEILAAKHRHMEETGFLQTLDDIDAPMEPLEEDPLKSAVWFLKIKIF